MNLPEFIDGQEGVFENLSDSDYRKAAGVSNSSLKAIALDGSEPGSPAHFASQFSTQKEDSDALFFGRIIHSRILTPNEPIPGIIAIPETYTNEKGEIKPWNGNAKICRNWIAKHESDGLRPMKVETIQAMDGVVNAIAQNETCKVAFSSGKPEVSLFKRWHRNEGCVLRKARLDWVTPGPALVDIKTCQDARAIEFARVIWARRYYVQFAYYLDLWNELNPDDQKTDFVVVAVEKFEPYNIQCFQIDHADLDKGRREYQRNLSLVIQCIKEGAWPGYPTDIQPIRMAIPFNRKDSID